MNNDRIIRIANVYPSGGQGGVVIDPQGVSPAVCECHGEVTRIVEYAFLRRSRTEEEKARRHIYGDVGVKFQAKDWLPRTDGISNTLTSVLKDNMLIESPNKSNQNMKKSKPAYRIRKLTPRECFRLMDVDDDRIDQIQAAGISKSQQYKLAGNSIVVSCLYHIFLKMFVHTDAPKTQPTQLTIFDI